MKSFRTQLSLAFLTILACAQFTVGQDQPDQPVTGYTYTVVNVPGASGTYAYAINNQSKIVGFYTGGGCSQTSCGFIEAKGKFTTVECALENGTNFFDINNKGEIVGAYSFVGGVHGFIWQGNSSCFDIVDPSGPGYTETWGVNDTGDLVGLYLDSAGNFQGFLYMNGAYTTISCPGWTDTRAYGINDAGVVVGDNANSTSGPFSGFVYKAGKCSAVNFPKAASTSAKSMNKTGQIAGWYTDTSSKTHGFVKTGITFQPLNYPGAIATLAYHMNDNGQVAGVYTDVNNLNHGFVATPKK